MPALQSEYIYEEMDNSDSDDVESVSDNTQMNPSSTNFPIMNVPEKIIMCFDLTRDALFDSYSNNSNNGDPFFQLQRCVSGFVHNKHLINDKHEFAVMSFDPSGVKWNSGFMNDPIEVIKIINDFKVVPQTEHVDINIMDIFKVVKEHIDELPDVNCKDIEYPNYIVRLILLYNSSSNMPLINTSHLDYVNLMSSDYFHFDILYSHDKTSAQNKCQEIYDKLLTIASTTSYVFENSRKVLKLFENMSKFLAHPLQRTEHPCISDDEFYQVNL